MMGSNKDAKDLLSKSKEDVSKDEKKRLNLLFLKSVNSGNLTLVQKLIERGVDKNTEGCIDSFNYTSPLILAAEKNYVELTKMLLCTKNINVNKGDRYGYTALHKASVMGHVDIVEALLEKKDIDVNVEENMQGATPLHMAARLNWEEVVEKLLKVEGILVNKKNKLAQTALHESVSTDHVEVTELLLNMPGILVNEADTGDSKTPLLLAANLGHSDVVEILLKHPEINVNVQDKYGQTALYTSAYNGNSQIVVMLLKSGIDVKLKSNSGLTAMQCATKNGQVRIVEIIDSYMKGLELPEMRTEINEIAQSMKRLEIPQDIEAQNLNDQLLAAAKKGELDKLQELLKTGADVNCKDRYLNTPLHLASRRGHHEVVKALLRMPNIEVNAKNKDVTKLLFPMYEENDKMRHKLKNGKTALHLAVAEGHLGVVKELLTYPKIDVNAKDKYDEFPLYEAVKNNNLEIAELLLVHPNIDVNAINTCNDHFSLLHTATEKGNLLVATALLNHPNINLNLKDKYHRLTPLELGVKKKRKEIVEAILNHQKS